MTSSIIQASRAFKSAPPSFPPTAVPVTTQTAKKLTMKPPVAAHAVTKRTSAPGCVQTAPNPPVPRAEKQDAQAENLRRLRETSGLRQVPTRMIFSRIKAASDAEGRISRERFTRVHAELLASHRVEPVPLYVREAVFDLFDYRCSHRLDVLELISGLALLCAGPEEERFHLVLECFDERSTGYISMEQMFVLLSTVFRVVLTPQVAKDIEKSLGVVVAAVDAFAEGAVRDCFALYELTADGKLAIRDFEEWFHAPMLDPSFGFLGDKTKPASILL